MKVLVWLLASFWSVLLFGSATALSQGLVLDNQQGDPGDTVVFTVWLDRAANAADAFGFDVLYDSQALRYRPGAFHRGELSDRFDFFDVNEPTPGQVRVGGFTTRNQINAGDSGSIVTLEFTVLNPGSTPLALMNLVDDFGGWPVQSGLLEGAAPPPSDTQIGGVAASPSSPQTGSRVLQPQHDRTGSTVLPPVQQTASPAASPPGPQTGRVTPPQPSNRIETTAPPPVHQTGSVGPSMSGSQTGEVARQPTRRQTGGRTPAAPSNQTGGQVPERSAQASLAAQEAARHTPPPAKAVVPARGPQSPASGQGEGAGAGRREALREGHAPQGVAGREAASGPVVAKMADAEQDNAGVRYGGFLPQSLRVALLAFAAVTLGVVVVVLVSLGERV